jgi:ribosomal protein S18 acetylase RimI-like enzyme
LPASLQVARATGGDPQIVSYLRQDIVKNALDIWGLERETQRFQLFVSREGNEIRAHLSIYDTPEAIYTSLAGDQNAAEPLFELIPPRTVLTTDNQLGELVIQKRKCDAIYSNDFMLLNRGEQRLRTPEKARTLSLESEIEYSSFGSSFNVPTLPIEWIRETLQKSIVFGVFDEGKLASVASLVAWLPEIAVIMGVETKPEFRRKGLSSIAVSATVQEGLRRSRACSLFVRSDNEPAISLYRSLGFRKTGEELWIDIGTGLIP